jgi:dephospho-CoA kinase
MNEEAVMKRQTGKLIIGLTGNIATGKSAVMRLAADRGALTIDADRLVHRIMDTDETMQANVVAAFGSRVRLPDGRIDRKILGNIVFYDRTAMRDLEGMLHPVVRQQVYQQIDETEATLIMVEAIKLLEGDISDSAAVHRTLWEHAANPGSRDVASTTPDWPSAWWPRVCASSAL